MSHREKESEVDICYVHIRKDNNKKIKSINYHKNLLKIENVFFISIFHLDNSYLFHSLGLHRKALLRT